MKMREDRLLVMSGKKFLAQLDNARCVGSIGLITDLYNERCFARLDGCQVGRLKLAAQNEPLHLFAPLVSVYHWR